jgi:hypothetical protein
MPVVFSSDKLVELLWKFFRDVNGSGVTTRQSMIDITVAADEQYEAVTMTDLNSLLRAPLLISPSDAVATLLNDCDDYAIQLKALWTAQQRQAALMSNTNLFPPSVGMVFGNKHVVSAFVTFKNGELTVGLVDASIKDQPITFDATDTTDFLLKDPAIRWVYF